MQCVAAWCLGIGQAMQAKPTVYCAILTTLATRSPGFQLESLQPSYAHQCKSSTSSSGAGNHKRMRSAHGARAVSAIFSQARQPNFTHVLEGLALCMGRFESDVFHTLLSLIALEATVG